MRPACLGLLLALGCSGGAASSGREDLRWRILLPVSVDRRQPFSFEVEAHHPDGRPASGTKFTWEIGWIGAPPDESVGRTFERQPARIRGDAGTARVRITVPDREGNPVVVAEKTFEIR